MRRVKTGRLTVGQAGELARLWRRCFPGESLHAHPAWHPWLGPMTAARIRQRIFSRKAFDPVGSFVAHVGGRMAGLALAAIRGAPAGDAGHLCALAVAPEHRRQGIGSLLLRCCERYLASRGARKALTGFEGNPLALLGGIPVNDQAYPFFLNRGYRTCEGGLLQVMTQDTTRFRLGQSFQELLRNLAKVGLRLGLADRCHYRGLDRLLAEHFPSWHKGIAAQLKQVPSRPVFVALRGDDVVGFSGPFSVGHAGRGDFFAIGVAPAQRGRGIGAALFNRMCAALKAGGARSISLTTELTNPAQEIYVRAGFRAVCILDYRMYKMLKPTGNGACR